MRDSILQNNINEQMIAVAKGSDFLPPAVAEPTENSSIDKRVATGKFAVQHENSITAQWWTGKQAIDPSEWTIDCSKYSMTEADLKPGSELYQRMVETYDRLGVVYLSNTRLEDVKLQRLFALIVMGEQMDYQGGGNSRDSVAPNVYEIGAPLVAALPYHHEMAYLNQSPKSLAFLVKAAVPSKGATYLSDNLAATEHALRTPLGQKLKELGVCYIRTLTNRELFNGKTPEGVYNHWQKSFGTNDKDEAERLAKAKGLFCDWSADGTLRTKYYVSAFEYFPKLDKNLLFASIADTGHWFDTWPLIQHLPYSERPLDMTWGDDTPMTFEERKEFSDLYDSFGIKLDWKKGDVAVFCNYRFLHGRPGIKLDEGEHRELGVLLGQKFQRVGDLADKW